MNAPSAAMHPVRHPVIDRLVAGLLILLMAVGSFCLWIGVPAGVLYGIAKLTDSSAQHLAFGVIAVPIAMLLFAMLLFRLNALYLRVMAAHHPAEDEDDQPQFRGPLEFFLLWSMAIAIVALAITINWPIAIALALVLIAFPRFPRSRW